MYQKCVGKTENTVELISLGRMQQTSAKTFDVSNISGYTKWNTGNFLLDITGSVTGKGTSSGWQDVNTNEVRVTVAKNYNSNTGAFTVTAKAQAYTNSGLENTQGLPVNVYVKY